MELIIFCLALWGIILGIVKFIVDRSPTFLRTGLPQTLAKKLSAAIDAISEYPRLCMLLAFTVPIVLRLAILPISGMPNGRSHDEFSYLLGGETFALGRLTNPTHPLWKFFETEHVIFQPTYASKYPPAQAIVLALGFLAGHPWNGVLLSWGAMFAAIYWMARAFLPKRYAALAWFLPLVQPGVNSYWVNSYFGGSLSAIGAALIFGAATRLHQNAIKPICWILLVIGLLITVNSRPFEGVIVCTPAACIILDALIKQRKNWKNISIALIAPLLIFIGGIAAMLEYNYACTGSYLKMPYSLWQEQYSPIRPWAFMGLTREPVYNHKILRDNYIRAEILDYYKVNTPTRWLQTIIKERLASAIQFFLGISLIPLAAFSVLAWRDKRMRPLEWSIVLLAIGMSLETYYQRHYMAPITAPLMVLLAQGFRHMRVLRWNGIRGGLALARATFCFLVIAFVTIFLRSADSWKQAQDAQEEFPRIRLMHQLNAIEGEHLVIVHYADGHNPRREYVINGPNIDQQKIVWAHEMTPQENQKLLDYYKGRKVWLFDPDAQGGPKLYPWDERNKFPLSTQINGDSWLKPQD